MYYNKGDSETQFATNNDKEDLTMEILTEKIRNIALIGHSGEGKTTLAEALLFNAGTIERQGRVDDGNTVMDFDAEEIAKKSSISLSVASATFDDYKFNIIDVPGFFDFEGELFEAVSVADAVVIVTTGSGAMSVGTEKAIEFCVEHKKPSMIFVSGLDKDNATFLRTVQAIRLKFPKLVASMYLPARENEKITSFISITSGRHYSLDGRDLGAIPERLVELYNREVNELSEISAENDEELLEKYVTYGKLEMQDMEKGINIGMKQCGLIPVVGGTGLKNQCVMYLKDKMKVLLPSPLTAEKPIVYSGDDLIELDRNPSAPVVIHVFKTIIDPFVGKLSLFKVESGTLKVGDTLHNMNNDKDEKITALYYVNGKKQEATNSIVCGDIGAVAKLDDIKTGDTLCQEGISVKFPPIEMPEPVYSMAVYAAKKGDEDKIFAGLKKLKEEDVSFTITKNTETGEMLLNGAGDTQLSVLCKKLKNKFGVDALLKEPKIAYRETIKKMAEAEGKHKKQGGGAGQFGVCSVRFEPGASDGKYEFVDAVVGGAVPRQFIPAVDKGLREAVEHGVLAGYPMVNLKCTLFDGKSHPVDSKEIAFISAAKLAYQSAIPQAKPCILEPVMTVQITAPDDFLGAVMGDVNKRRGRIVGTDTKGNKQIITAEIPDAELTKYSVELRSITQGRGKFTKEFARYEEVPEAYQSKIIEESKIIDS